MTEPPQKKYHWFVIFRKGTRVYTYQNRTEHDMTQVAKLHHDKCGAYPHRMWVIVDDEIQKVEIS